MQEFEIRSLLPEEIPQWVDHVSEVFETTARQCFINHLEGDPFSQLEGIRVAICKTTRKIASSVRVFTRRIFFEGKIISVGGIGEVSTKKEFQGRGLVKVLMKDATEYMNSLGMAVSLLHTSSTAGLYITLGYVPVSRNFVSKHFSYYSKKKVVSFPFEYEIREPNWKDGTELSELMNIHTLYSSRFNGPIVRDNLTYWTEWIPREPYHKCFLLFESSHSTSSESASTSKKLIGYISVGHERYDTTCLIVKDFCVCESEFQKDKGESIFHPFLTYVIQNFVVSSTDSSISTPFHRVNYPVALFPVKEIEQLELRPRLMYKVLDETQVPQNFCSVLNGSPNPYETKHLFSSLDKF